MRKCRCGHLDVSHKPTGCIGLYTWRPGPCGCPGFVEPVQAERIVMDLMDGRDG